MQAGRRGVILRLSYIDTGAATIDNIRKSQWGAGYRSAGSLPPEEGKSLTRAV